MAPAPQMSPPFGTAGDRKAENCAGPIPVVLDSSGESAGCQTTGMMVRVMMFQSLFRSIGMTGWMFRMF